MGQAIGSALASAAEANQVLTDMRLRGNGVDATAIRRMQAALSYLDISKSLGEDAGLDCDEQGAGLAWTTTEFDIADPSDEEDAATNEIGHALLRTLLQQVLGREKGHGPRFSEFMDTGSDTSLSSLRESTLSQLEPGQSPDGQPTQGGCRRQYCGGD